MGGVIRLRLLLFLDHCRACKSTNTMCGDSSVAVEKDFEHQLCVVTELLLWKGPQVATNLSLCSRYRHIVIWNFSQLRVELDKPSRRSAASFSKQLWFCSKIIQLRVCSESMKTLRRSQAAQCMSTDQHEGRAHHCPRLCKQCSR